MRIKSVLKGNEIGYDLSESGGMDNWDKRGNLALMMSLTSFRTFGDGNTQHSGAWCVQWDEMTDALISVTTAILADPMNEVWQRWHSTVNPVRRESIEFALSVKYKEGKEQWYSKELRKVTTSNKSNDRRFERVESYHDGSLKTVLGLLNERHWDFVQWYALAYEVREYFGENSLGYGRWEEIDPKLEKITGDYQTAFRAFKLAIDGVNALSYGSRLLESAVHHSTPKPIAEVAA